LNSTQYKTYARQYSRAKAGVIDGARIAWADKLKVPEKSISDQSALQGIIFLNEDFTIERVN
jgi:hypothetical protein